MPSFLASRHRAGGLQVVSHSRKSTDLVAGLILLWLAVPLAVLFHTGYFIPVALAGALSFILFIGVMWVLSTDEELNLLTRYMWGVLYLTISVLLGYAMFSDFSWAENFVLTEPLTRDRWSLDRMGMIGLVTQLAFGAGMLLANARKDHSPRGQGHGFFEKIAGQLGSRRTEMDIKPFILIAILGVIGYWLMTPKGTILSLSYEEVLAQQKAGSSFFGGGGGIIYLWSGLLALVWWDALATPEHNPSRRLKVIVALVAAFIVIFVFNFLRGSRTAAGFSVALFAIYVMKHANSAGGKGGSLWKFIRTLAAWRLFICAGTTLFAYYILDYVRSGLADNATDVGMGIEKIPIFFKNGTWMGAAMTNLVAADTTRDANYVYLMGETYWEYVLTLPPSIIEQLIGWERPIGTHTGPAWWFMGYTVGGLSPSVVPFMNFGMWGVIVVLFLEGYFVAYTENKAQGGGLMWGIAYIEILCCSMHWFWYGDMYIIRAMMCAVICWGIWKIASPVAASAMSMPRRAQRRPLAAVGQ